MNRPTLLEYATFYVRLFDGSLGYLQQFTWAIVGFQSWAERTLFIDELSAAQINDYLAYTKESLSPNTRISRRNMLVRIWRHAATNPALTIRPAQVNRDEIGRVKRRHRPPQGWSIEDVRKLYRFVDQLKGRYAKRIDKRLWWRAYVLCAWSSGLRRCDLMALRRADIPPSGRLVTVQVKTGRHVVGTLSKEAMLALAELCATHNSELVFAPWCKPRNWWKVAKRLVKRAGLNLSIGHLRHSAGTAVEDLFPGRGPQFLGNTPAVFYAHYYDRSLAVDLPKPPPLDICAGGTRE